MRYPWSATGARRRTVAVLVALMVLAAACGSAGTVKDGPTITVGSTSFGEQLILGDIYATVLERNGYPVERSFNLGTREAVNPALKSGQIDMLAEYTGTLLNFEGGMSTADSDETFAALQEVLAPAGLTALAYSPAQDKNGIVVTEETAARLDLATISDLARHGGELVFGGPPECPQRRFCLLGLEDVYGLEFAGFMALDAGGSLTVAALEGGDIDVGMMLTSDGVIAAKGFVLLEDDLGLQPVENIVPIVRTVIVEEYGDEFVSIIDAVSSAITTDELSELNRRLAEGEEPGALALDWLRANGFVDG